MLDLHEGILEEFADAGQGIYLREWLIAEGTISRRLANDADRFRERYHSDAEFREKIKARVKAWTEANREWYAAYQARYKEQHREELLAYWRAYDRRRREDPATAQRVREMARERNRRRLARLRATPGAYEAYLAHARERARARRAA